MTGPDDDERWVRRALELAQRGPAVDPNPQVGAVLVADGPDGPQVVGEGWHHGAGTAHAEVVALDAAGERARGATAYVSLEPCAHTGRTGPCTEALLAAGVARVVHASSDPGAGSGGGAQVLRDAGVEVRGGVLADEADALVRDWRFAIVHGRPRVTWKYASTLDGRVAAADGTSRWITGREARVDVGRARAQHGAVLVGVGTVLADDPQLTARDADGELLPRQPLRVVLGHRLVPRGARVLDGDAPTLHLPTHDVRAALAELHARGVRSVWLEGGPTVAAAFWRAGCVDDVIAYLAPALLGAGPSALGDLGVTTITQARRLRTEGVRLVGDDVRIDLSVGTADPDQHHEED
ncbi:bifunctional diaminohydroxyphosphoribosylaminopyrimidine deaminase/5-amino-6-(5-phosphoribosylamino)uracil reductase RibD [Janibacter melonis]|uniref:bifunctional diaminohydroxyphosphoribosylaminopyrimidine deaminase/5-amino-6-(5-phosphoribosylamino)uracil reductase RibD n=1 Tax=Janibacter melonis TaxID=262209 RepID=UPI000F3FCB78|nr:bifunctional diaminohydroxyphosphoribosylaminopyrimidine deaminase/5-amino-6-(5-phosphoribosylamino)uracil reductase RibD [Janibacter melonis]